MSVTGGTAYRIRFVRARITGRELRHRVPPGGLAPDEAFGGLPYLRGTARTVCGRTASGWVADGRGEPCRGCGLT